MEHNNTRGNGPERPQRIADIIKTAIEAAVSMPEVTAEASMLSKSMKPFVGSLCLGATRGLGDCPADGTARARHLYVESLGLAPAHVREALTVAKSDGVDPVAQSALYEVARRAIEGLLPFALEAYSEGKAIEAATLAVLPAERRGSSHSTVRDTSATHARGRLTAHAAGLNAWPVLAYSETTRLLGDESGLPLTDSQVNPEKRARPPATFFEKIDPAELAVRGLRVALPLCHRREDAEDLVQDALERMCKYGVQRDDFTFSYFATTIRNLATNRALDAAKGPLTPGDEIIEIFQPAHDDQERVELLAWNVKREILNEAGCGRRCRAASVSVSGTHYVSHQSADVAVAAIRELIARDELDDRPTSGKSRRTVAEVIASGAGAYSVEFSDEIAKRATHLLVTAALTVAGR
ncbi:MULTISPECIES: sigma-70 family RNA polymerase sigma factor [unclassified Nocardioides]|uniref:sigma-70 family RNA polymerase sigma factor n=1 Tax=unclassified Nocardioides TaxID=2615069 RepID=UPI00005701AE|nr:MULTISPECIES: sigma-70 family RNA polymerase sigma factor [unclassified Nocardioides]ABL80560.1 hypothetical protein Noca_1041 [Nocardioides sp. JS614]